VKLAEEKLMFKNGTIQQKGAILKMETWRKMSAKAQLAQNMARGRKELLSVIFVDGCCIVYVVCALYETMRELCKVK
jgi:hypothetical protein